MSDASSKPNTARALGVIFGVIGIFLIAQVLSVFILALILGIMGWTPEESSAWLLDHTVGQFVIILLVELITLLSVFLVLKKTKRSLNLLKFKKLSKPDVSMIVAGFAAYFALSFITQLILSLLIPAVDLEQSQQIGFDNANGPALWLVFLSLCVAVPIAEEVLFRGLLFQGLKKYLSLRAAAVVTSVIFGAAHLEFLNDNPLNWAAAIDTAVFSGVLIWVFIKRGNLWVPIGLHALKNSIAFIFLFLV